jgi:hypothetical protein
MTSEPQTPAQTIDYNFAREELMLNELSNDPIQTAIARLEKQHEEDKQGMSRVDLFLADWKFHKYSTVSLTENKLV